MRITGPTLRRRNHAWLQMRSLERRARLAQRQQQDDTTSDDADTSGDESDSASSADDSDSEPPRGLRVSVGLPRRAVRSVRIEGGAGNIAATASLTTKVDSTSDSETDVDSTDSADSSDSIETSDDSDNESPPPARPRVRSTRAVHARLGGRAVNHIATLPTKRQEVPAESSDSASSVDSSDGESEDESPQPTRVPTSSVRIGGKVKNALPTARSEVSPGASLSAEDAEGVEVESESDGEESDDETTSSPANAPPTATSGPPPPPAVTAPAATSEVAGRPPPASSDGPDRNRPPPPPPPPPPSMTSTPDTSSSIDDFLTSLTGVAPTQLTTLSLTSTSDGASPTVPATGNAQTGDSQDSAADSQANQREGDNLGITPMPQNKLSSGAVAGIVIGVLAFVALLAGALFFWWRRRRQQGLPFLPFVARNQPSSRSDDPNIAGPLPGEVGGPSHFKTNTEIMDDLMKAAYATDGGANDMEGAYGTAAEKFPPQQQTTAFMDEQAYAALAGPLAPPTPKKPVMEWLTEVRTPTQPNGPEIPPTPKMPPSVRMPMQSGGRVPEAPRTAYNGRETMTTETTNTSVRWYG